MRDDNQQQDEGADEAEGGAGRGWKIAAGVAVLAAAVSIGVLGSLLLGGSDAKPKADVRACIIKDRNFTGNDVPKAEAKLERNDGTVLVTGNGRGLDCPRKGDHVRTGLIQGSSDTGFELRAVIGPDRGKRLNFEVRKPDKPYIDIAHGQLHASLGQPVRIYTRKVDGKEVVVYMDDAGPL
ncbi:MAG: hypothetical protein JWM98_1745 [Thermoleophilia bacterium]|nr:hypothetical protein [Thermoleophilia bacterium]